jgi:hypothetical protein
MVKTTGDDVQRQHESLNNMLGAHYVRPINHWMRQLFPGMVQVAMVIFNQHGDPEQSGHRLTDALLVDTHALSGLALVLKDLYTDAYLGGHMRKSEVDDLLDELSVPLNTTQAALVEGDGLSLLQDQAPARATGVAATLGKRAGDTLTRAMLNKWTKERTRAALRQITISPAQAEAIAKTEAAAAQVAALLDRMEMNGQHEFDIITDSDPCPYCLALAEANPHTLGSATPPFHPRCQCTIQAV